MGRNNVERRYSAPAEPPVPFFEPIVRCTIMTSMARNCFECSLSRACPVGIEAICAELAEDRSTIEDAVEPWLLQAGLIKRGGKGRLATEAGRAHLAEVTS